MFERVRNLLSTTQKPVARDIVYDFAEILAQVKNPVMDERLLPWPKTDILLAFEEYIM